jgi:hypothetical protein
MDENIIKPNRGTTDNEYSKWLVEDQLQSLHPKKFGEDRRFNAYEPQKWMVFFQLQMKES